MKSNRLFTFGSAAAFIGMGVAFAMLGPTFSSLSQRFDMPLENSGIFPGLQFLGATITVLITGRLIDTINVRYLLTAGVIFLGGGLLILAAAPSLIFALLGVLVVGLGYGIMDVAVNVTTAALNPERPGAALNTLNFFYGVGAIIGPQLVNFALAQKNFTLAYIITAIFLLCLTIPFSMTSLHIHAQDVLREKVSIRWILLLPFAMMLFAYVGAEVGFSSWIYTQLAMVALASVSISTISASLFWAGLTASRGLANPVLRIITEEQLLIGSIVILAIGLVLLLTFPTQIPVALVCAFIAGFGCGPIFPTALAIAGEVYPAVRGTASGALIALGSLGGVALPWLQGQVGAGQNGGMPVVLILTIIMLGVGIWVYQQKPKAVASGQTV